MAAAPDTPSSRSPSALKRLSATLRGRPDSEHEMSFNRLAFAALIAIYLALAPGSGPEMLQVTTVYGIIAVLLFVHIVMRPGTCLTRRAIALVCDTGVLSYQLHLGGETASVLFPIYLWIILGNGFRFGVAWLRGAMAVGIACFAAVIATTSYWYEQEHLSIGLLMGLLVIPAYSGKLIAKLSHAKRQAEEANQAKSMFLAGVSHELRTPLTAIIGIGDLLQRSRLDAEQQDMLRTVNGAASQLLSLIDDILDLSRIEAGRMPTQVEEFDLLRVLDEAARLVATQARTKGLRLSTHVSVRTPLRLRGDARHLSEILINLLGNAVKFTETGSVVLAVDGTPAGEHDVRVRFEVIDTGIGIPEEAQTRIFESFAQADATIINRFGGTGLGLALCRRLVQQLGGTIGVESQAGVGSTFWFELSFGEVGTEGDLAPDLRDGAVLLLSAAGPHTEDLAAALESFGAEVLRAGDVTQAAGLLQALAAEEDAPRCILVRAEGIGITLDELAAALRALDRFGETPVLLLSDAFPAGLPPVDIRRSFATVLPAAPDREALQNALRLAVARQRSATPESLDAAVPEGPPLRILLADDNRVNQRVIAKVLEGAGHQVTVVSNGEEALDALQDEPFNLALMDLNMPVMDGLEAAKLYRFGAVGGPQVPIVALTADATPEAERRSHEAGMVACLVKPVQPARLLKMVATLALVTSDEEGEERRTEAVADIASHPRFRSAASPALDESVLNDLRALGGQEFVAEIVGDFCSDAEDLIREIASVAATGDGPLFRAKVHALRSGAANAGARAIADLCRLAQQFAGAEIAEKGGDFAERLAVELERVRSALAGQQAVGGRA